jgi:hypothetical protein
LHHELLLAGASLAISFVNVIGFNVLVCWHAWSFFFFFFFHFDSQYTFYWCLCMYSDDRNFHTLS